MYMYICIYIYTCIHTYTCIHYIYIYIYIYICIYIYIYVYTHTFFDAPVVLRQLSARGSAGTGGSLRTAPFEERI